MREDFGEINLGRQDDDFGDSAAFDEASSREVAREGDKTFGDGFYRGSGRLSVRPGGELSLHVDSELDATLIGGDGMVDDLRDVDKHKHGDLVGRHVDLGIDDNDYADDFVGMFNDVYGDSLHKFITIHFK